ncbi:MAG: MerR family transcriptional regulator [Acidithiobacillus sp.]|uniref:MerR family transcriptional regulator n=1 Tax=Acidithiobacillus sp. TaxID=1872118 RepID=UPI003CFCBCCA
MAVTRPPKGRLSALPEIPDKRYFSISEAAVLCGVKAHVLRYWEQEFPQLDPLKRRGNRRYYQQHDILLARRIRALLYADGYTIQGAREQLHRGVAETEGGGEPAQAPSGTASSDRRLRYLRQELEAMLDLCRQGH